MEDEWGANAARALTGVSPTEVDTRSPGFHAATLLFDLPPRAAAAYLGTDLLSLLEGLDFQEKVGLFDDVVTRANSLTCLTFPDFWEAVIRGCLSSGCQTAVEQVAHFPVSQRDLRSSSQEQIDALIALATDRTGAHSAFCWFCRSCCPGCARSSHHGVPAP